MHQIILTTWHEGLGHTRVSKSVYAKKKTRAAAERAAAKLNRRPWNLEGNEIRPPVFSVR